MTIFKDICILTNLVLVLSTTFAYAKEYKVEIRQISPEGSVYTVVCDDQQEICGLILPIIGEYGQATSKDRQIAVGMLFEQPGNVTLKFEWNGDFLYHNGKNYFHMFVESHEMKEKGMVEESVRLDIPHPLAKTDPEHSLVTRPSLETIAELKIKIKPASEFFIPEAFIAHPSDNPL